MMRRGSVILLLGLLWFSCDLYDEPFLEGGCSRAGFYNGAGGERVSLRATIIHQGMNQFRRPESCTGVNGTSDQFMETFMLTPGVACPKEIGCSVGNELGTGEYLLQEFHGF
jgi:hypothetical protein